MTAPARFKQSDVTRAIKGCEAADLRIGRIEIDASGKIVILPATAANQNRGNSWEDDRGKAAEIC